MVPSWLLKLDDRLGVGPPQLTQMLQRFAFGQPRQLGSVRFDKGQYLANEELRGASTTQRIAKEPIMHRWCPCT